LFADQAVDPLTLASQNVWVGLRQVFNPVSNHLLPFELNIVFDGRTHDLENLDLFVALRDCDHEFAP
jgi:hypothetical protein